MAGNGRWPFPNGCPLLRVRPRGPRRRRVRWTPSAGQPEGGNKLRTPVAGGRRMLADWRVFNQEFCCCRAAGVYNLSRGLSGAVWATGASVWARRGHRGGGARSPVAAHAKSTDRAARRPRRRRRGPRLGSVEPWVWMRPEPDVVFDQRASWWAVSPAGHGAGPLVSRRYAAPRMRAPPSRNALACTAPEARRPRCPVLTTQSASAIFLSRANLDAQGGLVAQGRAHRHARLAWHPRSMGGQRHPAADQR